METQCPKCGHPFTTNVAPGLMSSCPKCLAEFLMAETGAVEPLSGTNDPSRKPPLEPGSHIHDFEVLEFLGQGGMGFVYKARQTRLDRIVALKVLDPRLAASPEFTHRFTREAKALAALSHPNIVQIYDYGQEGPHCFLVMEFVDGVSLRSVLLTQRMPPETALRYVPQICDALEYAHAQGVIHRDIKPENILVDKRGNLKIADFGLAKMAAPEGPITGTATVTGRVMGTPHYMAPEQMKGLGSVDHRADIYSLGVVFYEMLTGELPIGKFPYPSASARVDARVDEVVLKALEKEPAKRYQRASQVKGDVTMITEGSGIGERGDYRAPSVSQPRVSRLAVAGALCLPGAIVLLVVLAALCVLFGHSLHDEEWAALGTLSGVVVLVGIILSISALVAIRNSNGQLRGRRLAKWTIGLPIGLCIAGIAVAVVKLNYVAAERSSMEEMQREAVAKMEALQADERIRDLWQRFCQTIPEDPKGGLVPTEVSMNDLYDFMEPSWREKAMNAGDGSEFKKQPSIFGLLLDKASGDLSVRFFTHAKIAKVELNDDLGNLSLTFRGKYF